MHREKISRMSHKGFFFIRNTKGIYFFGNFSLMLIFENILNANLFDAFL